MGKPALNLTDRQLKVYAEVQRTRMAWVALFSILILFSIVLYAFLRALFTVKDAGISTSITGIIDGTLGFIMKGVYAHLFPPPKSEKLDAPEAKSMTAGSAPTGKD